MTLSDRSHRSALLESSFRFFLCVAVLSYVIGFRYLAAYSWPESFPAQIYVMTAFLGHIALLSLIPWFVIVLPLAVVWPSRRWVRAMCIALGAAVLGFFHVDSLVFSADRFHLSALSLRVLGTPTWLFAAASFAIAVAACFFMLRLTHRRGVWSRVSSSLIFSLVVGACLLTSQVVHAWADVRYYVPITSFTPYLPLYKPLTSKRLLTRWIGSVDLAESRQAVAIDRLGEVQTGVLDYPREPLVCTPSERPANVLIIGLDAMRADAVDSRIAPSIARFAEQAQRFGSHWSGGNGTRPGLFSLFYGIPATYWSAFYAAQRAPVLIETFQRHGYAMSIFPSNPADRLVGLDRTAFRTIPDLPTTSGDEAVTQGWQRWLENRDPTHPFFGFLFYESAPGGCLPEHPRVSDVEISDSSDEGRRACYETALHFADSQVGKVLEHLGASGLMESTVVIVTSDHGEEFNENGLGFRGHGSGYSRYQLHVPMLVRWPGRSPTMFTHRTSHNDLAPTLLGEVLGCSTPAQAYSSGRSLFAEEDWPWLVAASYTSHAILEPSRITVTYGAYYEVRDAEYRLLDDPAYDVDVLRAAMRETTRFIRK